MPCKIKIFSWNANGISTKDDLLLNYINNEKIDIILLNETRLKKNKNFKIRGFTALRQDRIDDSGYGGVAILIKNNIHFKEISPIIGSSIEHLAIQLANKQNNNHISIQPP